MSYNNFDLFACFLTSACRRRAILNIAVSFVEDKEEEEDEEFCEGVGYPSNRVLPLNHISASLSIAFRRICSFCFINYSSCLFLLPPTPFSTYLMYFYKPKFYVVAYLVRE